MSRWDWGRNSYQDYWIVANREALEAAGWRDEKSLPRVPFQYHARPLVPGQQLFWKCKHHPIATENFFEMRISCIFGCSASELRWHDNGTHRSVNSVLGV